MPPDHPRVLHVYRTYYPETQGGLEEVIRQICLHTGHLGVESRVLTLAAEPGPAPIQLPEAQVHRVRRHAEFASCGLSWSFLPAFRRQTAWADVIHYHFPWPVSDLAHMLSPPGKPGVLTYHSDIIRQRLLSRLYSPLMHRFFRRMDAMVATSDNYLRTSPILRQYAHKTRVIPIGLGSADSTPTVPPDPLRTLQERVGEGFFLFIGVLRYYKGLHILLESQSGLTDPPGIVIAGSGPMQASLEAQARALGLRNIHFLGHVSDADKAALLTLCRAVVFPSHLRSEAFGVTLLEGAMHAKPLISTELGTGTSYVNQHGVTGLVVPPGDPPALRQALVTLQHHPDQARDMGRAARQRYEEHFTGARMAQGYHQLYQELLSAPSARHCP